MNEFEMLYRRHAAAIFRFAWGLCGDRDRAEELVSETFERILTRAPRIETRTALAYLLAVARNTYLTGLRRQRREVPLSEEIPAPGDGPGDRRHDRACVEAVLDALRNLPDGERAALLLRVDHELSYEEIAATLGVTVGAARVRVHRARLRLAQARDNMGGNDEDRGDAQRGERPVAAVPIGRGERGKPGSGRGLPGAG